MLPAEVATPLAMVLTELLQNAVEHGLRTAARSDRRVGGARGARDGAPAGRGRSTTGSGLPAGFDPGASAGSGLQIVRTLVEGELGGTLVLRTAAEVAGRGLWSTCRLRPEPAETGVATPGLARGADRAGGLVG